MVSSLPEKFSDALLHDNDGSAVFFGDHSNGT